MPRKAKQSSRKKPATPTPEASLDANQLESVNVVFQAALQPGEQELSVSSAKRALQELGVSAKSSEIRSFFNDPSLEALDSAQFLRISASWMIQKDKAIKAFDLMDVDGRGLLVVEDLQRVAQDLGEDLSREELEEMVSFVDRSGDGLLRAEDICRVARKVKL